MKSHWILAALIALQAAPGVVSGRLGPETALGAQTGEDESRIITRFALIRGVSKAEIAALRRKGLGWNDIAHVLVIAEKSGKPLLIVAWLRDSGLGWKDISKRYGLDPEEVGQRARELESSALGA